MLLVTCDSTSEIMSKLTFLHLSNNQLRNAEGLPEFSLPVGFASLSVLDLSMNMMSGAFHELFYIYTEQTFVPAQFEFQFLALSENKLEGPCFAYVCEY